ncbi:MAG: hypothetical protein IJM79_03650 [Erysipelotrichaceae bacterium]|nr:hypothetical protein [Erysipelotrichaceae bacterium]
MFRRSPSSKNWQTKHSIYPTTKDNAESILRQLVKFNTLSGREHQERKVDLPCPSRKRILDAKKQVRMVRLNTDLKVPYEGDSEQVEVFANKRAFFNHLGAIRLNQIVKDNHFYYKGQHKREKIDRLLKLPYTDTIIAAELQLCLNMSVAEYNATIKEARQAHYKKRGRLKKN